MSRSLIPKETPFHFPPWNVTLVQSQVEQHRGGGHLHEQASGGFMDSRIRGWRNNERKLILTLDIWLFCSLWSDPWGGIGLCAVQRRPTDSSVNDVKHKTVSSNHRSQYSIEIYIAPAYPASSSWQWKLTDPPRYLGSLSLTALQDTDGKFAISCAFC